MVLLFLAGSAIFQYPYGTSTPSYIEVNVVRGDVVQAITSIGNLRPIGMVEVSSSTSGQVSKVHVDFNDTVSRNQPLAEIDNRLLQASLNEFAAAADVAKANADMAEAKVKKAETQLADTRLRQSIAVSRYNGARARHRESESEVGRLEELLVRDRVASKDVEAARFAFQSSLSELEVAQLEQQATVLQIEGAKADLGMAQAELQNAQAVVKQRAAALERAQVELERATIRAPIDGFVVGRSVEPGQTVSSSLEAPTLFTIAEDLRKMEVHARVDESDIVRVLVGQIATVSVDAFPDRRFDGIVTQIRRLSSDEEGVVTYTIVLAVENPDLLLLPGMTALLEITVAERSDVLTVPDTAFHFQPKEANALSAALQSTAAADGGKQLLWMLGDSGELAPVLARPGLSDGTSTELLDSDIEEGQRVIVGTRVIRESRGLFGLKLKL